MSPENVSIIDSDRGLLTQDNGANAAAVFADQRAEDLKTNVERLLSARVGPGNAIVEITVDTTTDQETIVERRFDPESRVAISSDTEETTDSSSGSDGASVTVASNLPDGDAGTDGSSSKSNSSETRERINYEVSETTRELIRQPGTITRLSVAVMINGQLSTGPDGSEIRSPRSEEELASLLELVKSAIGYDEARGDNVVIRSLEFTPPLSAGTLAAFSPFSGLMANLASLVQASVLAVVVLGLGLFVVRPILATQTVPALPGPGLALPGRPLIDQQLELAGPNPAALEAIQEDPIAHLRQIISERQDETMEVLRHWIETSEDQV